MFLFTACVVVTVAGLRLGATLLVPLALALFITVVSLPLLNLLHRLKVPAGLAVLAVVVIDVTALLLIAWLLARSLADVGAALPAYRVRFADLEAVVLGWIAERGIDLAAASPAELIPYEPLVGMLTAFVRSTADMLANAFLIALVAVFLLAEAPRFREKLRSALGEQGTDLHWLAGVMHEVQQYLVLKTLVSALTGTLIGLSAWWLGVDFALLWGLLAFFLNFIPNVGSILAAVPAVLIAFLQLGYGIAAALLAVYVAVNVVVGNLIEPSLLGRRLGLSTATVILSLVFWGWVWGPVGMFLSVPLIMVTKIVLEQTVRYRWIAVLMSGAPRRAGKA